MSTTNYVSRLAGLFGVALACAISATTPAATDGARGAADSNPPVSDASSTSTDFLSDDNWRQLPREERRRRARASYIARFEPGGKPVADRLPDYVERYGQINIHDARLYVYRAKAELVPGTTGSVILKGEVSVPQYASGLEGTLEQLGFHVVRNEIEVLPLAEVSPAPYALSTTAVATVRREPRPRAEQVTSVAMGGWVRLLRKARPGDITTGSAQRTGRGVPEAGSGQWYLAQTMEGYVGYVQDEELSRTADLKVPDAMLAAPTTVTLASGREIAVPAGAFLHAVPGEADRFRVPHLEEPLPQSTRVAPIGRPVFTEEEILQTAAPLLGVKYVWGGTTDQGIDCSGFTQFMVRSKGRTLPRDAEEQATVGQIVAFGRDVEQLAQPGDLVFFVNERGRVNHIAMSLGRGCIIHSSGRDVHISHLSEVKDADDEKKRTLLDNVIFARRP